LFLNKRKLGSDYENVAAEYLKKEGYVLLEKNFRSRSGEIDLIAKHGEYLVFIEVKYRKNLRNGAPLEAVHPGKQFVIGQTARYYLLLHPKYQHMPCRFDVIGILGKEITLIQNAFYI